MNAASNEFSSRRAQLILRELKRLANGTGVE
jgi:hypothetical protein